MMALAPASAMQSPALLRSSLVLPGALYGCSHQHAVRLASKRRGLLGYATGKRVASVHSFAAGGLVIAAAATFPAFVRSRTRASKNTRPARPVQCITRAAAAGTSLPPVGADAGLLLIEHLNLNVLSTEVALAFYEALGCLRDARRPMNKTLHTNSGALTQFHTPSPANEVYIGESGAQRWRGEVEMLYESVAAIQAAVDRVRALIDQPAFSGSEVAVSEQEESTGKVVVTGPYGDCYALRVAPENQRNALGPSSGAQPGSEGCTCIGMGGVTLEVPVGTAARGARFFNEILGFEVKEADVGRWAVLGGPGGDSQRLVLVETPGATGQELGEHMAIYIGDYAGCFERLRSRGLIFLNERFKHLDWSSTLEEAMSFNCFRFKDIVDLDSGDLLFQLEHEVRSRDHRQCPLLRPETAAAAMA